MGMAGKTSRKSKKAKAGKGTKKRSEEAEPAPPTAGPVQSVPAPMPEGAAPAKKPDSICAFCGRPMKDLRTRMIHERSCRAKAAPTAEAQRPDMDAAILDIKDRFQDQVDAMARQMREREDLHQREMEEVKTVLRMEIDRHRKELERLSHVEKEVAMVEQKQEPPEPEPAPAQPTEEEPPRAQERGSQPKAIDMVPLPTPRLPRRREPLPEAEAIPEISGDYIQPAARPAPGLDREAVEAIVRSVMAQSAPATQEAGAEPSDKLEMFAARMAHMDQKMDRCVMDLQRAIDRIGKEADLKRFEKDLDKISERVLDIMEDSGYGESLSVSKIPPTILEIVYQAIIDDVYIEIIKTKGAQDAERIARSALEEVRLKTSGSELFKFDGRKIVTDSLARSIDANLISAKQIQTTYDVLLERLLETVPHHKAKNFKGMIKVKSQEFAVDRATKLTKEFVRVERELESANQMLAALSASLNAKGLELHDAISELRERSLAAKADREEVEALGRKLDEANERCARLADEVAIMSARGEMEAGIAERPEQAAEDVPLAPGEAPFVPSQDIAQPGDVMPIPEEPHPQTADEIAMQNEAILSAVGRGFDSRKTLLEETGMAEDLLGKRLAELVERKKLIEKRTGKKVRYSTLEREMEKAAETHPVPEPAPEPPAAEDVKAKKAGKGKKSADEPAPADEPTPEEQPREPAPEPPTPEPVQPAEGPEPVQEKPRKKAGKAEKARKGKRPKEAPIEPPREPEVKEPDKPTGEAVPPGKPKRSKKKAEEPIVKEQPPRERAPEPPAPEPDADSGHIANGLPVVRKGLDELSEDELAVLQAVSQEGVTVSGIQSKVGKHMKRFALLRALRVLIDSGHVGIVTKGRMELYCRITVEKMDTKELGENGKEVK